jgi:rubrerythrin
MEVKAMASAPSMCPKCKKFGTMEAVSERKGGFSGGKAVAGAVLLGPVGLLGGALGKKKVQFQCKSCGYIVEK